MIALKIDPDIVTPGVVGFFAIFAIALITVLLILDMNRRIRRTRYRSAVRERIELERAAEQEQAAATRKPDTEL